MTNDATPRAAGETHAGINPKTGRNPRPTPPNRRAAPALPEPVDALDLLDRIKEIASHWECLILGVLETNSYCASIVPDPLPPLPDWAVGRLKDQGRMAAIEREFQDKIRTLEDWLQLASGNGSDHRFEVWTSRGSRLAFRHESWQDAAKVLDTLKSQFPDAFIAKINVMDAKPLARSEPELLDTMIGRIQHIGTWFGEGEKAEMLAVQDETGRQVMTPADTLHQHPVYASLDRKGQEYVEFHMQRIARKKAKP
ncbi:hypothetical protein INR38_18780 [Delftia sp. SD018]|uniref:hypothetical protein n=1 Tax=unclassified Delftia TaxID=2613839 RepID=UPI001A95D2E5|nr:MULTISPECIES: hypothetical protein [unclassified Delftia]MBO0987585.1 hypothetical protein [Delftia sp. SD083]MBO1036124.1 hypothetical protein [Delftia sp. SD018]